MSVRQQSSRPSRAAAALLSGALLAGCGGAYAGASSSAAATAAAKPPKQRPVLEPALAACVRTRPLVDRTAADVSAATQGVVASGTSKRVKAPPDKVKLDKAVRQLQAEARRAGDDAVEHALQDAADAVQAYAAVAGDESLGAYGDAVSDANGMLRGFAQTCPQPDPGFEDGVGDWTVASLLTAVEVVPDGHTGSRALRLTNQGVSTATLSLHASKKAQLRTVKGFDYRVGVWARTNQAGAPTLTLTVREVDKDGRQLATWGAGHELTADWAFTGLLAEPTSAGSGLEISVQMAGVPARGGVLLDELAVARH